MNWEAIGAIGEVVAAAAVIFTLIYLAVQIRQNTATIRISESAHRATIETELNKLFHERRRDLYTDAQLTKIYLWVW